MEETVAKRKRVEDDTEPDSKRRKPNLESTEEHVIDRLKGENLELIKERDVLKVQLKAVREEKTNEQAKFDDDRRSFLEKLKFVQEKEKEARDALKELKDVQTHASEKVDKDVEDVNERLKNKMKEFEMMKVQKMREVNSALEQVQNLKLQLNCQANEIKLLKGQLSENIDEDGLPVIKEEEKGVKSEVEEVKALMADLKETYEKNDSGRIDPADTEGTSKVCALERENRDLKAKLDEETEEKETKWSLMEMANSERVKTKEMMQKLKRLIELEEKIQPLEEENMKWQKFLENCLTGCETITQAEIKLNEILQESLDNIRKIKELETKFKILKHQHGRLSKQFVSKREESEKFQEKLKMAQSQLKSTKRDVELFKEMSATRKKMLNEFEQLKNVDLDSIQSRRVKTLQKEVDNLTKQLSERTAEKEEAEKALLQER